VHHGLIAVLTVLTGLAGLAVAIAIVVIVAAAHFVTTLSVRPLRGATATATASVDVAVLVPLVVRRQTVHVGTASRIANPNDRRVPIPRVRLLNYVHVTTTVNDLHHDISVLAGQRANGACAVVSGLSLPNVIRPDLAPAHDDLYFAVDTAAPLEELATLCLVLPILRQRGRRQANDCRCR
jgi:hypothetical protein